MASGNNGRPIWWQTEPPKSYHDFQSPVHRLATKAFEPKNVVTNCGSFLGIATTPEQYADLLEQKAEIDSHRL